MAISRTLGFALGDLIAVYEHKLRGIDPHAGHDAPVCPTPEALAHLAELRGAWAENMVRAQRRRLWKRRVG